MRYEVAGAPVELYVCHCRECQKQSASAFGISVFVRAADFRLTQGAVKKWSRVTATGRTLDCSFCPACGSRLWHQSRGEDMLSVKGGALDAPVDIRDAVHLWTTRSLPGVVIPADARQFAEEPT